MPSEDGLVDIITFCPERQWAGAQQGLTPESEMERLFVYGTLMRGEARNVLLHRGGARYLASGHVSGRLIDLGPYPALTPGPGLVSGELYDLGGAPGLLALVDEIEGSRYRRETVEVETGGGIVAAWAYLWAGARGAGKVISSGDWRRR